MNVNLELIQYNAILTSIRSIANFSSSSLKLVENVVVSLLYEFVEAKPENLCCLGIIGVKAGDGIGVGNSRMGERHLFTFDGTSSKIVGGFKALLLALLVVDLCAFNGSRTGTSIETFGK